MSGISIVSVSCQFRWSFADDDTVRLHLSPAVHLLAIRGDQPVSIPVDESGGQGCSEVAPAFRSRGAPQHHRHIQHGPALLRDEFHAGQNPTRHDAPGSGLSEPLPLYRNAEARENLGRYSRAERSRCHCEYQHFVFLVRGSPHSLLDCQAGREEMLQQPRIRLREHSLLSGHLSALHSNVDPIVFPGNVIGVDGVLLDMRLSSQLYELEHSLHVHPADWRHLPAVPVHQPAPEVAGLLSFSLNHCLIPLLRRFQVHVQSQCAGRLAGNVSSDS